MTPGGGRRPSLTRSPTGPSLEGVRPLLIAALALALPAAAQDTAEVIPLRHRPAADLVPVLQSMLGSDGVVASLDSRLVVRATPEAMARVKALVRDLDVPLRSLWITVRQTGQHRESSVHGGVTVQGGSGTRVGTDGHGTTTTTRRTVATGALSAGRASGDDETLQRLRAVEGQPAFISVGRALAVPQAVLTPGGVAAGAAYVEAATGFWVLPRLSGDLVSLELAATQDAFTPAGLERRGVDSTLSGRLGDWLQVGSHALQSREQQAAILAGGRASLDESWSVSLRIEAVEAP